MNNLEQRPVSMVSAEVAVCGKPSLSPKPFASPMVGREQRVLGDLLGLHNRTTETVIYLKMGDCTLGNEPHNLDEDLQALFREESRVFLHKTAVLVHD